jgi:hypothetical protein
MEGASIRSRAAKKRKKLKKTENFYSNPSQEFPGRGFSFYFE